MQMPPSVLTFLKGQLLGVLSTIHEDGTPESAVIEVAFGDAYELIFNTFITYRKYANLQKNPHIACVVGWDENVTIQYEGSAREVSGEDERRAHDIFFRAHPDAKKWLNDDRTRFFIVRPTWIRYTNYNKDPWEILEQNF